MNLTAAWTQYLEGCRWFGGKGRGGQIVASRPLDWYTPAGATPAVRSELATVRYADGDQETYHLVVAYYPPGTAPGAPLVEAELEGLGLVDVIDAPTDPAAMAAMVTGLLTEPPAGMTWSRPEAIDPTVPMRLYTGEQSNTTVVIGDVLFKLFRKLEPGRNLDAEVLLALTGSGITPAGYGVLASPEGSYDLGMFAEKVGNVTDGWLFATAACAAGTDISTACQALGGELHDLHLRLRTLFGAGSRSGAQLGTAMLDRFDEATAQVPALVDYTGVAATLFDDFGGAELPTQRIHGDFHLGQVLYRDAEPHWVIIDFEGEPLKSLQQRREFDTPWRDVAGLLRSLDYARSAHAEPNGADARNWAARMQSAFLAGYGQPTAAEAEVLAAYQFDKAVYEVVYETRNRPDWAAIPWRAVQDEARRIGVDAPGMTKKEH